MHPKRTLLAAAVITGLAASMLLAPAPSQAFSLGGLFGSRVDKELVAQVPKDKRAAIDKADFDNAVANEEVALAKLKEELADRQDDYASIATKLAKAQATGTELALDTARINAVDAANLGKKEDNQKIMADLREDSIKNENERIQLKAKLDQTDVLCATSKIAWRTKNRPSQPSRPAGPERRRPPQWPQQRLQRPLQHPQP